MKSFNHPLMHNNISSDDLKKIIDFLKTKPILTHSKKVFEFEKKWSEWLGVKYSIFVNSGSSANFLSMKCIRELYGEGEVILPPLTWISDVVATVESGFKPKFADIKMETLSLNENEIFKKITKKTKAVFITHAQGFNGLSDKLLKTLKKKKIILIEDVCESHGATFKNKKLGSFGLISNFSFYYAHHMTTIEGGMICTNNKKIYEIIRMLRSHGMVRESGNKIFEKKMIKKYKNLSPKFIFLHKGFNMRNNEISAVMGLNQLKSLDRNNLKRTKNFEHFLKKIDDQIFFKKFDTNGSSNYAFPIILKSKSIKFRDKFEELMKKNKIEFRRGNAGGGNQLRQPYIKNLIGKINFKEFSVVEHVHSFGYYIGNFPDLSIKKIDLICKILNSIKKEIK
jgi:CDP-4-dehydro-6-deoxyglucose reductase, E1